MENIKDDKVKLISDDVKAKHVQTSELISKQGVDDIEDKDLIKQ